MSWRQFQEEARLTHALPYVYYQGKTISKKILWLMSVKNKHFTMRHLIMGLGRVQESKYVKICEPSRQRQIMEAAKETYEMFEKRARDELEAKRIVEVQIGEAAQIGEAVMTADMEVNFASMQDEEPGVHADPFEEVEFD